jgi:ABC-type transport system involved in multi-copper enzyme maturation permease subunit
MYAWKCWRESRARFIFLVTMFAASALLLTLLPGLEERNGWSHFDRSVYTRDPATMVLIVSRLVLNVLWVSGFLSAVFLGATAPGSEIEPGTIEYLWTRPRTRSSVTWTHWGMCLAEMAIVAVVPTYLAAVILGMLTRNWNMPLLLVAPWVMVSVGVPMLGLTTLMTTLRRSASGGLIFTAGLVSAYVFVRQIVTVTLHLPLPTLFSGPMIWLMTNDQPGPSVFPWGSLWRAVFLAAALPLAAQYLLKRAEV